MYMPEPGTPGNRPPRGVESEDEEELVDDGSPEALEAQSRALISNMEFKLMQLRSNMPTAIARAGENTETTKEMRDDFFAFASRVNKMAERIGITKEELEAGVPDDEF